VVARKTVPRENLPIEIFDPLAWFKKYLAGGNPMVRIGVIILFFGMAFLAKYAIDQGIISIEIRLSAIALHVIWSHNRWLETAKEQRRIWFNPARRWYCHDLPGHFCCGKTLHTLPSFKCF